MNLKSHKSTGFDRTKQFRSAICNHRKRLVFQVGGASEDDDVINKIYLIEFMQGTKRYPINEFALLVLLIQFNSITGGGKLFFAFVVYFIRS
jgi:hypothetical protein